MSLPLEGWSFLSGTVRDASGVVALSVDPTAVAPEALAALAALGEQTVAPRIEGAELVVTTVAGEQRHPIRDLDADDQARTDVKAAATLLIAELQTASGWTPARCLSFVRWLWRAHRLMHKLMAGG